MYAKYDKRLINFALSLGYTMDQELPRACLTEWCIKFDIEAETIYLLRRMLVNRFNLLVVDPVDCLVRLQQSVYPSLELAPNFKVSRNKDNLLFYSDGRHVHTFTQDSILKLESLLCTPEYEVRCDNVLVRKLMIAMLEKYDYRKIVDKGGDDTCSHLHFCPVKRTYFIGSRTCGGGNEVATEDLPEVADPDKHRYIELGSYTARRMSNGFRFLDHDWTLQDFNKVKGLCDGSD